jgi:hypothetical protein
MGTISDYWTRNTTLRGAGVRYRNALKFENSLLVDNYSKRLQYRLEDRMAFYHDINVPEDKLEKWKAKFISKMPVNIENYRKTLDSTVESKVKSYVENLAKGFGIDVF